jgi:hypothetical protein
VAVLLRFNQIPPCRVRKSTVDESVERECGYQWPWNPLHGTSIAYLSVALLVHFGLITINLSRNAELITVKVNADKT